MSVVRSFRPYRRGCGRWWIVAHRWTAVRRQKRRRFIAWRGRRILMPGDLSVDGGNRLMTLMPKKLPHEVIFMAHHGQYGVNKAFYGMEKPRVAICPTPRWLWNNARSTGLKNRPGGRRKQRLSDQLCKMATISPLTSVSSATAFCDSLGEATLPIDSRTCAGSSLLLHLASRVCCVLRTHPKIVV